MSDKYLEKINSPADLRTLDKSELALVAGELRDMIIKTVSQTGGHLAPSLGVVELTIALHYLFDTPRDKIVWDVGHQTYAHKILTGRRDKFHTLRQAGGISGFPKTKESEYDTFNTGHSSTSISAALGMVVARDFLHEDYNVIAVIGDGALTGGLALEGLNNVGHLDKDIIVVLNDNEMSISPNVGAMSSYLSRIMTSDYYQRFRDETKHILKALPEPFSRVVKKTEEVFKGMVSPGMLFEELGFTYAGPIMGHNLKSLLENFKNIKKMRGPRLIHVITTKGKGYEPAEKKPDRFHGIGKFDIETGEPIKKKGQKPSYTNIFSDAIISLAKENKKIVCITAAMPAGTGLSKFSKIFPERFYDVGIAEQHAVTFAAGLATKGLVPVVAVYSTFAQRAYDQILHDVCLQNLNVVFCFDRSGLVGADGPTHHGLFDYSFLRNIPNIVVMAPKDGRELKAMLKAAVNYKKGAVAVRYPRGEAAEVKTDKPLEDIEIGKGELLIEGSGVVMIPVGSMVTPCMKAAKKLEKEGINPTVINARFIKPVDSDLIIKHAKKVKKVVTIEENVLMGGFGSAILEELEEKKVYDVHVMRIGIPDKFIEHGDQTYLRKKCGLDEQSIYLKVKEFLGK
jgi:1-deoxy-D-xylulose-5-phosphate synthase